MTTAAAIQKLSRIGYRFTVVGDTLKITYHGPGKPDPAKVKPLFKLLKSHKAEALALLQTRTPATRCRDCEHAQVGSAYALCRGPAPWDGIPGQDPDELRPCLGFKQRVSQVPEAEPEVPSCNDCPWCLNNPWTHYPDLPKWCGYWWDHLSADKPQCLDQREGRVPDPKAGDSRAKPPQNDPRRRPPRGDLERAKDLAFTCYECAHFDLAHFSPNPAQAWGECRLLGKGRYGLVRACDGFRAKAKDTLKLRE